MFVVQIVKKVEFYFEFFEHSIIPKNPSIRYGVCGDTGIHWVIEKFACRQIK